MAMTGSGVLVDGEHAPRAVATVSPALDAAIDTVVCIPSFRRPQHLRKTLESGSSCLESRPGAVRLSARGATIDIRKIDDLLYGNDASASSHISHEIEEPLLLDFLRRNFGHAP